MKNQENIPDLDLKISTIEVKSEVRKLRLTRRNTFYKGLKGKVKCIYYWLRFIKEKNMISFGEWLDEPVAYKVELPNNAYFHHSATFNKEIEKELEHYLVDEVAKERAQQN